MESPRGTRTGQRHRTTWRMAQGSFQLSQQELPPEGGTLAPADLRSPQARTVQGSPQAWSRDGLGHAQGQSRDSYSSGHPTPSRPQSTEGFRHGAGNAVSQADESSSPSSALCVPCSFLRSGKEGEVTSDFGLLCQRGVPATRSI